MNIIKNIIQEITKLVENDSIECSYDTFEDACTITFGKKQITVYIFYNTEQKYYYYQIKIPNKNAENLPYNIVVPSKNKELFEKVEYLYELVKTQSFERDPNLQSILSELKKGIFEDKNDEVANKQNNVNLNTDDLPF